MAPFVRTVVELVETVVGVAADTVVVGIFEVSDTVVAHRTHHQSHHFYSAHSS